MNRFIPTWLTFLAAQAALTSAFIGPLTPTIHFGRSRLDYSSPTQTHSLAFDLAYETRQRHSSQTLQMAASSRTTGLSSTTSRPKKTVRDRTQQEAVDLIRDIVKCSIEAGPRAGFARTFQAFNAVTTTIKDFLPVKPDGSRGQKFTASVALRTLFERLGATYIKLGQFIASSPTLFPSEYVLEFQKCLDATEPLPWNVIKGVIEKEIGESLFVKCR